MLLSLKLDHGKPPPSTSIDRLSNNSSLAQKMVSGIVYAYSVSTPSHYSRFLCLATG
ncbi:hypothetical protein HYPBUDRAFT_151282 [Hyphopichia burtonii NRRL Y-1933]|uniref:Uncharacterized protein n=1 Tax=Hyphopichia burtonii NRRL Y-1933 TaxID=984485 RepID=A0A1E4RQT3_9ASCO|nr:hypothetical protein HYPBUDRAFT_151282 [Hyphopichia burtonii NRRL Y-1933]ODV69571.1 hypothetical protein HYPBUDRAFT_151282 [Hyphopichia burtonii NRRL Y-1933]